jgi:hypothetical protein
MDRRHAPITRTSARGALLILIVTALALAAFAIEPPAISGDAPTRESIDAP